MSLQGIGGGVTRAGSDGGVIFTPRRGEPFSDSSPTHAAENLSLSQTSSSSLSLSYVEPNLSSRSQIFCLYAPTVRWVRTAGARHASGSGRSRRRAGTAEQCEARASQATLSMRAPGPGSKPRGRICSHTAGTARLGHASGGAVEWPILARKLSPKLACADQAASLGLSARTMTAMLNDIIIQMTAAAISCGALKLVMRGVVRTGCGGLSLGACFAALLARERRCA